MGRHLITTRRWIPLDRLEDYLAAWVTLRASIRQRGGHAWLFRGEDREDRFLEFIETDSSSPLLADPVVTEAREALEDAFGHEESATWTDAPEGADAEA